MLSRNLREAVNCVLRCCCRCAVSALWALTVSSACLLVLLQVVPTPWGMVPAVPAGMPPMWMPRPGMMPGMAMPYPIAYQQVHLASLNWSRLFGWLSHTCCGLPAVEVQPRLQRTWTPLLTILPSC